jgi:hypothetical protein
MVSYEFTSVSHLIFNFPLCKLYTNSLMSSLNSRKGWGFSAASESSERPGISIDVEKTTVSHGISSQIPDDPNWRSKQVNNSQTDGSENRYKKFIVRFL